MQNKTKIITEESSCEDSQLGTCHVGDHCKLKTSLWRTRNRQHVLVCKAREICAPSGPHCQQTEQLAGVGHTTRLLRDDGGRYRLWHAGFTLILSVTQADVPYSELLCLGARRYQAYKLSRVKRAWGISSYLNHFFWTHRQYYDFEFPSLQVHKKDPHCLILQDIHGA